MTIYQYQHGKLLQTDDLISDYLLSLQHCMEFLRKGYLAQGYHPVGAEAAVSEIMRSGLDYVVGDTWIAGFSVERPWFLRESICMEEFYGPRWLENTVDLKDFLDGALAYAKHEGADRLEFGTRANPRHKALARLCEQHGAAIAAVTLTKVVDHGIG